MPLLLGLAMWADPGRYPDLRSAALWAVPASAVPGMFYWRFGRHSNEPLPPILASASLFILTVGFIYAGGNGLLDGKKQEYLQVALFLDTESFTQISLATLETPNEPYVFYTQRQVRSLNNLDDLQTALADADTAGLILILPRDKFEQLPPDLSPRLLYPGMTRSSGSLSMVVFDNVDAATP